MDGQSQYDLSGLSSAQLQEIQEDLDDEKEDQMEDQSELSLEMQEAYGAPEPSQTHNQHTFLHKAAFDAKDTVRTTFLTESELGRPLFSVRFLSDLYDISKYYLDPILVQLGKDPQTHNGIANYFWEKTQNITNSGLSNKGFAMNISVTQKRDMVKKRVRAQDANLKGGQQKQR